MPNACLLPIDNLNVLLKLPNANNYGTIIVALYRPDYTHSTPNIRLFQKYTFLSNWKNHVYHNFFPLFRSKALQKTKFWKFSCIFWTSPSCSKFYYVTHLCEIDLTRNFNFLQLFYCKAIYFFTHFYMENVFFWDALCWLSSTNNHLAWGFILQNFK